MSKDYSREWLKVNKIYKEIKWLSYDPDYKDIDLQKALEIIEKLKERLRLEIDK